jgi:hypothetical protein
MASANCGGSPSPTSPRRIAAAERQAQALALRKEGLTLVEIAKRLGYAGDAGVRKAIRAGLERTVQKPADELRSLILARIDRMMTVVYPRAIAGDLAAVDRVIKLNHQAAVIYGLLPMKSGAGRIPRAELVDSDVPVKAGDATAVLSQLGSEDLKALSELRDRLASRMGSSAGKASDAESDAGVADDDAYAISNCTNAPA